LAEKQYTVNPLFDNRCRTSNFNVGVSNVQQLAIEMVRSGRSYPDRLNVVHKKKVDEFVKKYYDMKNQ